MNEPSPLTRTARMTILLAGFLGWLLAGVQLAVSSIVMRDAVKGLAQSQGEGDIGSWFGWLISSFMFGAAAGGYLFGWLGDRCGRRSAMAFSIAVYSAFAGLTYFVQTPTQLLWMRFMVGLGVGGMWPNGIALVSEAWPNLSRPMLAGVIGTAANVGIMLFSLLTCYVHVTVEEWRWVMGLSAAPLLLAAFVRLAVPESPRWLALKNGARDADAGREDGSTQASPPTAVSPLVEVFRPPILRVTLVGIVLGTIPLFGGWGSSNWANAWASQVGEQQTQDPALKSRTLLARSAPGSLSSLLGGAVATLVGRKRFYFFLSVACLGCAQYLFHNSHPLNDDFFFWTGALGLFSGFFFGWLPLCLPELFPTRIRSTGAGVSFNFGRIATALGILIAAGLLKERFQGDYARIGQLTSWIYLFGAVAIWFAPDTDTHGLND